jgi:twitching motility protein PilT
MHSLLLGQLLVNFGLINEIQLKSALDLQRKRVPRRLLGEILVEEGMVDENALRGILTVQKRKVESQKAITGGDEALRKRLTGQPLHEYLRVARELGASDLHLTPGQRPALRWNGFLKEVPIEPLSVEQCRTLLTQALCAEDLAKFEQRKSVDAALHDETAGRFRAHFFHHSGGMAGVLRAIADTAWEFEQIGLPPQLLQVCKYDQGLVLITGTIGSGKSTTLAALLQQINRTRKVHVITIEDPIEVVHKSQQSLVSQREVGVHTRDFASALRAALREDPDVLVVGEMRDLETTSIALTAAETGHLVFATMHTSAADRTIHRILDQYPAHQREHARAVLANVLRCVVCQQLIPTTDGKSRLLAAEILNVTSAVANLIREDRMHQVHAAMQLGKRDGMKLMDDSLQELVKAKRIPLEEALARATEPERFVMPVAGGES